MIGGLGVQELLIVFIIALVLFGGKRLPEVGQNLGKALRGFKDSSEQAMDEMKRENTAASGGGGPEGEEEGKREEEKEGSPDDAAAAKAAPDMAEDSKEPE
jgi:sec-independent protein translocase protein TatA